MLRVENEGASLNSTVVFETNKAPRENTMSQREGLREGDWLATEKRKMKKRIMKRQKH